MANFELPEIPEFSTTMRMLEITDPAIFSLFNTLFFQLLKNDDFLNKALGTKVSSEILWYRDTDEIDTLLEFILSKIEEGHTEGTIQIAFETGYPSDLASEYEGRVEMYALCKYVKHGFNFVAVTFTEDNGGTTYFRKLKYNDTTDGEWLFDWIEIVDEQGYVSKGGDTMYGNLTINKSVIPEFILKTLYGESRIYRNASDSVEDGLHIIDFGKDLTYATRSLLKLSHEAALESALTFSRSTSDGNEQFNIFGEHNFVIDANSSSYDMDTIIKSGAHFRMYKTTMNTLGTPYKYGVTSLTAALILSYASSENNGVQIAFMSGGVMYVRTFSSGNLQSWDTGFLPIYGGNLQGNSLGLVNGKDTLYDSGSTLQLIWREAVGGNTAAKLDLSDLSRNGLRYISVDANGNTNIYDLFGTHNKPSGTYTGTSASRTINTGGIGNLLLIIAPNYLGFVTPGGAVFYYSSSNGTVYRFTEDDINYIDGVITIGSGSNVASACFNYSGYSYQYYCI